MGIITQRKRKENSLQPCKKLPTARKVWALTTSNERRQWMHEFIKNKTHNSAEKYLLDKNERTYISQLLFNLEIHNAELRRNQYHDYELWIGGKRIAWTSIVENKGNLPSKEYARRRQHKAMRGLIDYQIKNFRLQNEYHGCENGKNCDGPLEVHHILKFHILADKFIGKYGEPKTTETINLWEEYHSKNAKLQMLCRKHNAAEG